ncbi:PhzF family phenazine biosynthesis protein [Singulisphaera sp. PoT]|uniref:PhzF family phenazine biosynthesis protein n=1 Tax=Singulisphaera sp. PoT TaxID=3411797 RepID=UPI003BF5448F
MGQTVVQVDAFTDRPFAGNPAAVCVLPEPGDDRWMQDVAREMNLSETSFLHREGDAFRLRWFTPVVEVDLCGHATLAAAHVLWQDGHLDEGSTARFQTRSGLLTASFNDGWITLDFPSKPIVPTATSFTKDVAALAVNAPVEFAGLNEFDGLVEVESEDVVRALRPDIARIAAIPVRGLIVTGRSKTSEFDFVSRFFAPRLGVDEDPVCGSAHCCLGPYWAEKLGKTHLKAYQASPRGGSLRIQVDGPRTRLSGRAVTVMRGELV